MSHVDETIGSRFSAVLVARLRVFHCQSCGMCVGRDLNAAMNIRARGFPGCA